MLIPCSVGRNRTLLEESIEIASSLTTEERERLLPCTINGLEENNAIRTRVTEIEIFIATKIQRVIEIFDSNEVMDDKEDNAIVLYSDDDIEEFEGVMNEIDKLDQEAKKLVILQKKRTIEGQTLIARFLAFLKILNKGS